MRFRRVSGVPHSSSASSTISVGERTLVAMADNGSRRRISNFVFRLDGSKSPISFKWLTRVSAMVWLCTAREYAIVWKTSPG